MNASSPHPNGNRVVASLALHPDGRPHGFSLAAGDESIDLTPGHDWVHADRFKWVTRGLMEPPQSFSVHADGTVEWNGDSFAPDGPESAEALTTRLNTRHVTAAKPKAPRPRQAASQASAASSTVHFAVRLDAYGHIQIRASRGSEHTDTGLRGLSRLAAEGWMRSPSHFYVDPLQKLLELNDQKFEATADGAVALESYLNAHFVPPPAAAGHAAIEIRDNAASSTGFDIQFPVHRAGTRIDIHGHLSQEKLDQLQDVEHCDLLQQGVIVRLAPPFLYFRRRRRDGGEEPIPELGDVKYRSIRAAELQRLLNHPAIRRGGDPNSEPVALPESAPDVTSTPTPAPSPAPAAAAHPSAPLHAPPATPPALPPTPVKATPPPERARPAETTAPKPPPLPPTAGELAALAEVHPAPFHPLRDPHEVNEGVLRVASATTGHAVQSVLLTLDRVFRDRPFDVINLDGDPVTSVFELRSAQFHGFYLVHLSHQRLDLVYAHRGTHLEWGTDRCLVQPRAAAESVEFGEPALLGFGRFPNGDYGFVVTRRFREWVRPFESDCAAAQARFMTSADATAGADGFQLLWPQAS